MSERTSPFQIAIIGGGPAGLMAAEHLAAPDRIVTVYDRMPTLGRKFLMAGRGGLNLTHSESLDIFMRRYGAAESWLAPVITAFPPDALRAWCAGLGQETIVGSSGRVFPKEMKASPLLRAWLRRLEAAGVRFAPRHEWKGWDENSALVFSNPKTVHADAVILALGGASWPRLGSDGRWVDILRGQNIDVRNLRPANCGFVAPWSDMFSEKYAGRPLKPVILSFAGKALQGEAMVTKNGLEGGAIYALSGALRETIDREGTAILTIDLRPGLSIEEIVKRLDAPRGSQSMSTYLRKAAGLAPVAIGLMRETLDGALPNHTQALAALIKETKIRLTAAAPITRAISSAGGINRDAVDAGFMLRKKPGVFAIGEMLDWEAPTGGYLLQASFSMAVAAAKGVRDYLES
jgi:uncharacterized flavoprotein (TIGR03862 family)